MVTITVKTNGQRLSGTPFTDARLMRELGLLARERVIRRTQGGRDETGAVFTPYSPSYAALKGQALGSSSPVNLQVSGRMLQGLTLTQVTDTSVTIGFKD